MLTSCLRADYDLNLPLLSPSSQFYETTMKCKVCKAEAVVALKARNAAFCEKCYLDFFRKQVDRGIREKMLFTRADRILVAISGGKDSLSLLLELVEQGYDATGLFVDLAIPGSSDVAREVVTGFCAGHNLNLRIVSLAEEGLAIPMVKRALRRPICSACGKIKRYFFNMMALKGGYDALATGHNLDDETARLFNNVLRWDQAYLSDQGPLLDAQNGFARKVKPLWRLSEFETANYAFIRGIEHHVATCPYSKGASFTRLKGILQRLEQAMPGRKLDFYHGFLERGREHFANAEKRSGKILHPCVQCGYPTSGEELCGVCRIRELTKECPVEDRGKAKDNRCAWAGSDQKQTTILK